MVRFILNDEEIQARQAPGTTLLDFIRYHQSLTGTKIGCREGDCGACTVLIGHCAEGRLRYRSVTSCLMPLSNAMGTHVVTVEGLNQEGLNPVQQAIVRNGGTQCGFCTVGFVVSWCGFCLSDTAKVYENAIAAIDGNICRCTGYKSLQRAARDLVAQLHPYGATPKLETLVDQGFVPSYFVDIPNRLSRLREGLKSDDGEEIPGQRVAIGGGTDLYVQKAESMVNASISNLALRGNGGSRQDRDRIYFDMASTAEDLMSSQAISNSIARMGLFMKLVSSTQIRNMGTIAGNFINASPIGDLTIMFLALDASLMVGHKGKNRELKLQDLYLGYKQLNLQPGEIVETISIRTPPESAHFNFEKVSKRTHLDIASVNSACYLEMSSGTIQRARIAAGGVAPVPLLLARTSDFLVGKTPNESTIKEANRMAQEEISPISDVRGSADYKRLLLRQLLYAHFLELFPEIIEPESLVC